FGQLDGPAHPEVEPDSRVRARKSSQQTRQRGVREVLGGPKANASIGTRALQAQPRFPIGIEDPSRMDREILAQRGQHAPTPGWGEYRPTSDGLFKPLHLRRDRRRRSANDIRSSRQRAGVNESDERAKQVGIDKPHHNSYVSNYISKTIQFYWID